MLTISIEGPSLSGKTTLACLLAGFLQSEGYVLGLVQDTNPYAEEFILTGEPMRNRKSNDRVVSLRVGAKTLPRISKEEAREAILQFYGLEK